MTSTKPWETRFAQALATFHQRQPAQAIADIADLAFEVPEALADGYLDTHDYWQSFRAIATRTYYDYIVDIERQEVDRMLALPDQAGRRYAEMASAKGLVSYQRVADMFDHVDFTSCGRFVMVGCGQLPVTALHVMDRTAVSELVLLDVSQHAVEMVRRLTRKFGWGAIDVRLCSGKDFDFVGAHTVYIGNMVTPKLETVCQALATAPYDVRLIVREPYSLGRLWAEKVEHLVSDDLEILGRGAVSRHLSRDLFLRRRPFCANAV